MQLATGPYILRSIYKDEHIVDTHVTQPLTNLVTAVFGGQFTNRYDSHLPSLAKGLYFAFALSRGQTLGEEFCSLLPVTFGTHARLLGTVRKMLLALLLTLEPAALFQFAIRVAPLVPPHDVISNVHKVKMMFFFLFEAYGTLAHRLLRVRFLGLVPSQTLGDNDGGPHKYRVLGILVMLELCVRLRRFLNGMRMTTHTALHHDAAGEKNSHEDNHSNLDDDEEDNKEAGSGKCMLCLGNRKQPTATLCGHIFCWRCLSEWIKSNTHGAICPFCRRRITVQSSVPLYFYVAKEAPRVGDAHDTS